MSKFVTLGRILLAIAMVSLGLEHFITGHFPVALFPFPADFPGRFVVVILMGIILVVAGLSIGLLRKADVAAFGLGILFLLAMLGLHLPSLVANVYNGNTWTVFGELMGFSGGAFYVSGVLSQPLAMGSEPRFNWIRVGNFLFAASLLIFGVLHFVYAGYIATLIPSWIPAPLFWAYFVGVAFLGTSVSLLVNWQRTLFAGLLGLMFLLWVLLLHAPRVIKNPRIEPEWTSLLVALTMSGIAFTIAGAKDQKTVATRANTLPTP